MRYVITSDINDDFMVKYPFLQSFGYEEDASWFVDKELLDQIDRSGDAESTVNEVCLEKYAMTRSEFFDDKVDLKNQYYLVQKEKNAEGFDCYEKIIGSIAEAGGIPGSVDGGIEVYKQLTTIRMMLKDGMFDAALRFLHTDILAISPFTTEQNDYFVSLIEQHCLKYGATAAEINALKTVPKGSL